MREPLRLLRFKLTPGRSDKSSPAPRGSSEQRCLSRVCAMRPKLSCFHADAAALVRRRKGQPPPRVCFSVVTRLRSLLCFAAVTQPLLLPIMNTTGPHPLAHFFRQLLFSAVLFGRSEQSLLICSCIRTMIDRLAKTLYQSSLPDGNANFMCCIEPFPLARARPQHP